MTHEVDTYVGRRLRQCRLFLGMSQGELASKVGIKFQQIQKYETGANRISASRLWDIAAALQVDVRYFFDGLEDDGAAPMSAEPVVDKEAVTLLRYFNAMPDAQRRRLFDLAQAMSSDAA